MSREAPAGGGIQALAPNRYAIDGPLTFETVERMLELPVDWWREAEPVMLDLSGVPRADSAGLALLLEWWRQARRARRELKLVNVPDRLRDLIRVSGLQAIFPNGAQ